jgi:hypothetical protein
MRVKSRNRAAGLFQRVDHAVTDWMARHGLVLLRVSLGIVVGATVRGGGMRAEAR